MTRPAWWTALGGTLAVALYWMTGDLGGTVTMAACAVAATWCVERVTR